MELFEPTPKMVSRFFTAVGKDYFIFSFILGLECSWSKVANRWPTKSVFRRSSDSHGYEIRTW